MNKNLLLSLSSLIFIILLLEVFVKFYYPQNLSTPFRTISKDGLVLNIKNSNATHYFRGKKKATYHFGQYHERTYDIKKNENKIIILGDSFTFGWLLNDEDTFVYKLDKYYKNYSFINASGGGWGLSDAIKYFENFCQIIKPQYSIFIIHSTSLPRSRNSNLFKIGNNGELISDKVVSYNFLNKMTENFIYKFLAENSHLLNILRKKIAEITFNKKKQIKNIPNEVSEGKKISKKENKKKNYNFEKKLFYKIRDEANKCNTELILVNLGWSNLYLSNDDDFFENNYNFFSHNFEYIDLTERMTIIRENLPKYIIQHDRHPNELGNEIIYNFLRQKLDKYLKQ